MTEKGYTVSIWRDGTGARGIEISTETDGGGYNVTAWVVLIGRDEVDEFVQLIARAAVEAFELPEVKGEHIRHVLDLEGRGET